MLNQYIKVCTQDQNNYQEHLLQIQESSLNFLNMEKQEKCLVNFHSIEYSFEWHRMSGKLTSFSMLNVSRKETSRYFGSTSELDKLQSFLNGKIFESNMNSEFTIVDLLFQNRKSLVYKCIHNITGKHYAAKFVEKTEFNDELRVHSILHRHPLKSILHCKRIFVDENHIIILTKYLTGGTLYQYQISNKSIPIETTKIILKKLLKALSHLSKFGILHRDIKMDNIMLKDQSPKSVKLIDFGLSIQLDELPFKKTKCGTPGYMAPELFENDIYNGKCDIYGLGHVLHCLLSGQKLYNQNLSRDELIKQNQINRLTLSKRVKCPLGRDLITKMVQKHPENRYSAEQCLQHPFLKSKKLSYQQSQLVTLQFKNPFPY